MKITVKTNGVAKDYVVECIDDGFAIVGGLPQPCIGRKFFIDQQEVEVFGETMIEGEDNRPMYHYFYRNAE